VHDVLRVDAWPHHDAHLRELGAHFAELLCDHALRGVELGRQIEQRRAFGVERCELAPIVGHSAVTHRIFDRRHGSFPSRSHSGEAAKPTLRGRCDNEPRIGSRTTCRTASLQPVLAILAKNRYDEAGAVG
jgi:hypothetical protein